MGYKSRAVVAETETCLSEAFLFATMCIIGLPVDVHIRDGSVYSGTLHTASVDKHFGIVLKEAKLTKKGKCETNVASGSIIETLVILSGDLVQVVAKGVQFPPNGVYRNVASEYGEAAEGNVPSEIVEGEERGCNNTSIDRKIINDNRTSAKNKISTANGSMLIKAGREHRDKKFLPIHTGTAMEVEHGKRDGLNNCKGREASDASVIGRQIGEHMSQEDQAHHSLNSELQREKSDDEVQSSSSTCSCLSDPKAVEEGQMIVKVLPNGVSCDLPPTKLDDQCCGRSASPSTSSLNTVCSNISPSCSPLVDVASESHSGSLSSSADMVSPQSSDSTKSSKEFKLNPGAKTFYPSFAAPVSVTAAVPAAAGMAYLPNNSPMVPVAAAQPEVGTGPFALRPSVPAKFALYSNFAAVNGVSGPQFSQPIVGHMGSRTQPLRYASQYHAVQATPTYVPPHSQAVMVGRLGQLVYVQPVPHDLVQSTATVSPLSARPMLTPHQVQYPKHQGSAAGQAMQLCAPPPYLASGQQPHQFAMPSHIPLLQHPIPVNRTIPVPGPNSLFGTKFP